MPISCHLPGDCKSLLTTSPFHVRSAIASSGLYLYLYNNLVELGVPGLRSSVDWTRTRRSHGSSGSRTVARWRATSNRTGTDCVSCSLTPRDRTIRPSTRAGPPPTPGPPIPLPHSALKAVSYTHLTLPTNREV